MQYTTYEADRGMQAEKEKGEAEKQAVKVTGQACMHQCQHIIEDVQPAFIILQAQGRFHDYSSCTWLAYREEGCQYYRADKNAL
jgi:hypothetical protein